uniref:Thiolase C-terminal domain-containing protein n=2 Tax=Spongospora subterranea TaxID=70186 RepID=A0A0H5QNU0_9EUKA|eukprot:CRZ03257.1 hypothetical protein [Spongospora subterranea]
MEGRRAVAVVAGDAVSSLTKEEFLKRADRSCQDPSKSLPSPCIPHGYDRVAQWQSLTYGTKREQLAMCSVLMSEMACRHKFALTKKARTLEEVLQSPPVAPMTNLLECARRADGAAAVILASNAFLEKGGIPTNQSVVVISGGEASGSLYPPPIEDISEHIFSCQQAAVIAYEKAQLGVNDIDYFGLYDCFPICMIRAIEAVGLAPLGQGGDYIEDKYNRMMESTTRDNLQDIFPVNTHGGLLSFGAPWEAPALYSVIEAITQLTGQAANRQIRNAKRALVYGNGGIFSSSAVAILGRGIY